MRTAAHELQPIAQQFSMPVSARLCHAKPALQIGAVNAHILSVPWLSVRAIDLRPCLPSIERADFLDLQPVAAYDVVVCAMVLNCVPTAIKRGQMLMNMRRHLQPGGHAFIIIPLRCLNDSPYMTAEHFEAALQAVGFLVCVRSVIIILL